MSKVQVEDVRDHGDVGLSIGTETDGCGLEYNKLESNPYFSLPHLWILLCFIYRQIIII